MRICWMLKRIKFKNGLIKSMVKMLKIIKFLKKLKSNGKIS